jgi:signal peptidase I
MDKKELAKRLVWGKNPRRTLLRTLVLGLLVGLTARFAFRPSMLDGSSMEPTYEDRSLNVINLLHYRFSDPKRDEVVAIPTEQGGRRYYLKRVLALPSETIEFRDGQRFINGSPLPETYLAARGHWEFKAMTLGPTEYFLAGDNRAIEFDYHKAGGVDRKQIVGRIVFTKDK